ncbi:uncharacterized protein LOC142234469 [Haematobia irritans]|uniref:uncharacterized protein LOC142234469 n=1 Tax=Haematobia irritans TaxID=7368 RepID=UPI003F4FDDDA
MSYVWEYFEKQQNDSSNAKCSICKKILSCRGSSTSSLIQHLRNIHKKEMEPKTKRQVDSPEVVMDEEPDTSKRKKYGPLDQYTVKKSNTLSDILARCVAEDGMSVRALKKSKTVNEYIAIKGFKMPASEATIWSLIHDVYEEKKKEYMDIFSKVKNNDGRVSITVDEWSDISGTKYVNVSVRSYECGTFQTYNLGLEEIKEAASAVNIQSIVENKLKDFGLNFENDVVASTHDGASVMKKYGNIISPISQLCMNHAIHLSVVETLYSKVTLKQRNYSSCSDSSDEEFANDNRLEVDASMELIPDVAETVRKVRKTVVSFRKSSLKQRKLQEFVSKNEGKEIRLICDVKHRWNSLSNMLETFFC